MPISEPPDQTGKPHQQINEQMLDHSSRVIR